ncbi:hypothetical protein T07_13955 [Trichinella nelsoni]|uniref:Uncharacterized protein n=1 Tax=Trichinella nelsoni TaxID=6336 RepID=A0A0V0RKN2_9BILA|nr:hypothetical protein T07_13955 [Trichinella nelsoni]
MELMIINRSKTIRKVQQTYTGGSRLRLSRDMQKKCEPYPCIRRDYIPSLEAIYSTTTENCALKL